MSSNTPFKPLVHLSRPSSRNNESSSHLPRGDCRFISTGGDGLKERCPCASFTLNSTIPGTQCQCGHQSWAHTAAPVGDFVPVEEHMAVVDRLKKLEQEARLTREELARERKAREKLQGDVNTLVRGAYGNMAFLRYYTDEKLEAQRINFEDKIEGALDRAAGAASENQHLGQRVIDLDEYVMRLEERIDSGRILSRAMTPVLEEKAKPIQLPLHQNLPFRSRSQENVATNDTTSELCAVRIVLVPKKTQRWAFTPDSKAYKRCQSRGFMQQLEFPDKDSGSFTKGTEAKFNSIFKGRPWMPLQCLNSADMSLSQLHMEQRNPSLWNYAFLEAQCMANDKEQGDVIYVALMHEELGWLDIYNLSPLWGYDQSCWGTDEELDGKVISAQMDFKMDLDHSRVRNLETDSMYEYSPPPYSQRTASMSEYRMPTAHSALNALADAALTDERRPPRTPSISERSAYSSIHSAPSISDRSIEGVIYEDEDESGHRDKRPKHGRGGVPGQSLPSSPPNQQKMYYSGRAKRKIDPAKQKEPLNWSIHDMKISNPMKGMLHRKHTGDKDEQVPPGSSDGPKAEASA